MDAAVEKPMDARDTAQFALNKALGGFLSGKRGLRVLEAGGGSRSHITALDDISDIHMTAIDISREQLDNNQYANEKILGDLQQYRYAPGSYDCIVCYDVLEHLAQPEQAFTLLSEGLKPGGYFVVGSPNPLSLKGLITRLTPHAFHVFVYRVLFGEKRAGQPGFPPFETVMSKWVEPGNLVRLAKQNRLEVAYRDLYDSDPLKRNSWIVRGIWGLACGVLTVVTFLRWNPRLSDYHFVFVKRAVAENGAPV